MKTQDNRRASSPPLIAFRASHKACRGYCGLCQPTGMRRVCLRLLKPHLQIAIYSRHSILLSRQQHPVFCLQKDVAVGAKSAHSDHVMQMLM